MNNLDHLVWRAKLAQKHAKRSGFASTAAVLADIAAILENLTNRGPELTQLLAEPAAPQVLH